MSALAQEAARQVEALDAFSPKEGHLKTGAIRKLSARLYRTIPERSLPAVLEECEALLQQRSWPLEVIAFDWAYRVKSLYDETTYDVFYRWLETYVRGWGDCDDFCTHAFGELLRRQKALFARVIDWTEHRDFWVRRAAAVVLIPALLQGDTQGIQPLRIADRLLADPHDLVRKGYGWMLKCLSQREPETVIRYLEAHHGEMPRVAYRYALEKLDKDTRRRLMDLE